MIVFYQAAMFVTFLSYAFIACAVVYICALARWSDAILSNYVLNMRRTAIVLFMILLANFVASCALEHFFTFAHGGRHGEAGHSLVALYEAASSGVFAVIFSIAAMRIRRVARMLGDR
ncbi:MAG: hypothetical protein AAGD92_01595 [Pseudomonadota bacterium]